MTFKLIIDAGHGGPAPEQDAPFSEWRDWRKHKSGVIAGNVETRDFRDETGLLLGSVGVSGDLVEKDITLLLVHELDAALTALPLEIFLTRTDDTALSLSARGMLAQKCLADFVLSIHVNSAETPRGGADVFHWPGNPDGFEIARVVAEAMPEALRNTKSKARVWDATEKYWPRVRNVIGKYKATAVLVECGYATSEHDRNYILSRWGRAGIVSALRAGVCKAAELHEQEVVQQ